jgi:hypothetical protein
MRRLFDVLLLCSVVAGGAYLAYTHPAQVKHLIRVARDKVAPCSAPLTYSIGTIDPRFGVSTSTLVADLQEAADVWEEPTGKNLFEYLDHGGEVTVSLSYDTRQEATNQLSSLGSQIDQSKASYDSLKAQYDSLSSRVASLRRDYQSEVSSYKTEEAKYEAQVQKWNSEGGAPPDEYAKLSAQKSSLQSQITTIRADESKLNSDIDSLNAMATTLNQLIVHLNLNVEQYNQTGAESGEFEEGLYELKNGIETITVYEFSNHTKLVRVLAHEMGHALGLDHVGDPNAIMYQTNAASAVKTTAADIAEFDAICHSSQ